MLNVGIGMGGERGEEKPRKDGDGSLVAFSSRKKKDHPSPAIIRDILADCNCRGRLDIGEPRSEQCLLIIDHSRGQRAFAAAEVEGRRQLTPFTLFKCESACMSNGRVYGRGDTHERARPALNVPSAARETRDHKLETRGIARGGGRGTKSRD